MTQIFGDFKDGPPNTQEYFMFGFSPHSSIPFDELWEANGLLADFLAHYLIFYRNRDIQKLKEEVSFIANELLENARKFNDETVEYPISIQFQLHRDHLILSATNNVPKKNVEGFQLFIQELLHSDLQKLYIREVERVNAQNDLTAGRLGLLMMIRNYKAKVGWKFETVQQAPEMIIVTTMVQLAIE